MVISGRPLHRPVRTNSANSPLEPLSSKDNCAYISISVRQITKVGLTCQRTWSALGHVLPVSHRSIDLAQIQGRKESATGTPSEPPDSICDVTQSRVCLLDFLGQCLALEVVLHSV